MSSNNETPVDKNINAVVNALLKTYIYTSIDLVPIPKGATTNFQIFGSLINPSTDEERTKLDEIYQHNEGFILGNNNKNFSDLIPMIKMSTILKQESIDITANNGYSRSTKI